MTEIYFRNPDDPKYNPLYLEENDEKEILLNKIRMILFTNRGEVLGEPELGLNLEDYLFDFDIPIDVIKRRFYAQLAKFVPENKYKIDLDIQITTNNIQKFANLYIKIDDAVVIGINLS